MNLVKRLLTVPKLISKAASYLLTEAHMNLEPFQIGTTCLYPNIFEPRPGSTQHKPSYCIRIDTRTADIPNAEWGHIAKFYAQYLPCITVNATRPPIISVSSDYPVLMEAMEIAKVRRLFLDGVLIGMQAKLTCQWFKVEHPNASMDYSLGLRGIEFDAHDFYNKVTARYP